MNENLQNALVEILNKAISGIDTSVAFMQAELPDVIHQLLTWYVVKGAAGALVSIVFVIPFIILSTKAIRVDYLNAEKSSFFVDYYPTLDNQISFAAAISLMGSGVVAGFGAMFFYSNLMSAVKIWIAPKIWLMEYAATLVK